MPSTRAVISTDRYAATLPTYSRTTGTVAERTAITPTCGVGGGPLRLLLLGAAPGEGSDDEERQRKAAQRAAAGQLRIG